MKAKEFIKEFRDIDPADDPNAGMDKDFKQEPMFNQFGKILDSQGNPTNAIQDFSLINVRY